MNAHTDLNDTSAQRYNPQAAKLAWKRTLAFFKRTLAFFKRTLDD